MSELNRYRENIDRIDEEIIQLFQKRMELACSISNYKRKHNIPVLDAKREREVLEKATEYIEKTEYLPYANLLLQMIMDLSKTYQERQIRANKPD